MKLMVDFSIVLHIINFVVIYFIFKKYLSKYVIVAINKRKEFVESEAIQGEKNRIESYRIQEELKKELADIKAEKKEILERALNESEAIKNEILARTYEQRDHIIQKSRKEVAELKVGLQDSLKQEALLLAVKISEKIISRKVDDTMQDEFLASLKKGLDVSEI